MGSKKSGKGKNRSGGLRGGNLSKSSLNSQMGASPKVLQRNEVVERGVPGFAVPRYRCKLRYYDAISLSTGAASAGTYVYSANGLYDPDITSTGHQPMPFDQLMLSFNHYCVVGARMHLSLKNASTTNSIGFAISAKADSTAISNVINLIENGCLVRDRLAVSPASESLKALELPIDIGKFGSVPDLLSNPDYNGSSAANPVEQSYFHVSVWNPDSASAVSAIIGEVMIEYDAWFFEPRVNSASLVGALSRLIFQEDKSKRAVDEKKCKN